MLESWFQLEAAGTTAWREVRAGLVTFLTMSYILFVNPQILSQAGMPVTDVAVATALASSIATLVMALWAKHPFALAPGMGLNAYFVFGVVLGHGVSWQVALAAVFVEGLLFLALSLSGARTALIQAIPQTLKLAMTCGIGFFLAMIGLQNAGIVVSHEATLVALGDLHAPSAMLALAGVVLIGALHARRVPGAILVGMVSVAAVAWGSGLAPAPQGIFSRPSLPTETFLAMDLAGLFSGNALGIVVAFFFVDLFDTAGTLVGVGRMSGALDKKGELPRADRAFTADAVGTVAGAALGTSTVTSYIESATGIEEGGRTGLTAATVAVLFALAIFFTPILVAVPAFATAPALILVGSMMMRSVSEIDFSKVTLAVPAFLTIVTMPFTFSIANGITLGIVSFVALHLLAGRAKQLSPVLVGLAVTLLVLHAFKLVG